MLANFGAFSSAMNDIASYFSVPTLGGLYKNPANAFTGFIQKVADIFSIGIPIYPDKYEETGGNEIGQQIIVGGIESAADLNSVGALSKIADNVVVSPRVWKIHGYMGINIEHGSYMQTAATFGGVPVLSQINTTFGRDALNMVMKKYVKYVADARRPFKFTTSEGETVPALIQSYSIKNEPDNLNWLDVDLTIQEFRFVSLTDGRQQAIINGGPWGSVMSMTKQLARAALKSVAMKTATYTGRGR